MEKFKKFIDSIISWVKGNGVEGVLGAVLGTWFFFLGWYFFSGLAFGVFVCKNWEMIKKWIIKKWKAVKS